MKRIISTFIFFWAVFAATYSQNEASLVVTLADGTTTCYELFTKPALLLLIFFYAISATYTWILAQEIDKQWFAHFPYYTTCTLLIHSYTWLLHSYIRIPHRVCLFLLPFQFSKVMLLSCRIHQTIYQYRGILVSVLHQITVPKASNRRPI